MYLIEGLFLPYSGILCVPYSRPNIHAIALYDDISPHMLTHFRLYEKATQGNMDCTNLMVSYSVLTQIPTFLYIQKGRANN